MYCQRMRDGLMGSLSGGSLAECSAFPLETSLFCVCGSSGQSFHLPDLKPVGNFLLVTLKVIKCWCINLAIMPNPLNVITSLLKTKQNPQKW